MLQLKGVTKQYLYGARLFGALDLTLASGEILAVLGKSGSGKTSLMKCISGVEPAEGEILLDGKRVNAKTDDVIMLFDDGALFKGKTVFDNLAYPLAIRKVDKKAIAEKVISSAELFGIGACLPLRPGKLTAEERRRVSLTRLFLRDAKLLLIDDLTKGLTKEESRALFSDASKALLDKAKQGVTVVYSTSEPEEAARLADRILVLADGEIKQLGTAEELWNCPKSIWAAQAMDNEYNFAKAVLSCDNDRLNLVFETENGKALVDVAALKEKILPQYIGKTVYVGWHPEDTSDGEISERVAYAYPGRDGYLLETVSGIKVKASAKAAEVKYAPILTGLTLYDAATENSVMRD